MESDPSLPQGKQLDHDEYLRLRRDLLMRLMKREIDRESYELMLSELNTLFHLTAGVSQGMSLADAAVHASRAAESASIEGGDERRPPSTVTQARASRSTRRASGQQLSDADGMGSFVTTAAASHVGAVLQPGQKVLEYRVVKRLGRGGMGMVYQAEEPGGRTVAIKLFPSTLIGNTREMARVNQTFDAVRTLEHAHIAAVHRLVEHDSLGIILVMEFCPGTTLDEYTEAMRAQGRQVTIAEVCRVLRPIAEALDYAHSRKVIHRDIKPQNIMLDADGGNVRLIDFGLADQIRTSMVSVSNTTTSEVAGTRAYMASEQWQGHQADGKTDQYALACVAYEMLAGHPPFLAGEPAVLERCHRTEPVPPLENFNALVNAVFWIDDATSSDQCALAKKRSQRFASCTAFIDALREREPQQAGYPADWRVYGTGAMSHQSAVCLARAVGDGRVFATADDQGQLVVWDQTTRQPIRRVKLRSPLSALVPGANGRWLYLGTAAGELVLMDITSGKTLHAVIAHEGAIRAMAIGPGGTLASGGDDGVLRLFDPQNLTIQSETSPTPVPVTAVGWSPGGLLAWGQADGVIHIVNPATEELVASVEAHRSAVRGLCFSRENRTIVSFGDDGCLHAHSLAGKHRMHTFVESPARLLCLEMLADSDRFVAASSDGRCYTFELYKRIQVGVATAVNATATSACYLSQKRVMLLGEQSGLLRMVNLERFSEVVSGQSYLYPVCGLALSETLDALLTAHTSGELIMWDYSTQKMANRRMLAESPMVQMGLLDSGRVLCALHRDGQVALYNAVNSRRIRPTRFSPPAASSMVCLQSSNELLLADRAGELRGFVWPLSAKSNTPYSEDLQFSCFDGTDNQQLMQPGDSMLGFEADEASLSLHVALGGGPVVRMAVHEKMRMLLAIFERSALVLDMQSRRGVGHMPDRAYVCGAFSPDGISLAMGCSEGSLTICNIMGEKLAELYPFDGPVTAVALAPDSVTLAAAGNDRTVMLWRKGLENRPQVLQFQSVVRVIRFTGSGMLLAGLEDGTTARTAPLC